MFDDEDEGYEAAGEPDGPGVAVMVLVLLAVGYAVAYMLGGAA